MEMIKQYILKKYPLLNFNNVEMKISGVNYKIFVRNPDLYLDFFEDLTDLRLYQESHVVSPDIDFSKFVAKIQKVLRKKLKFISFSWLDSEAKCIVKICKDLRKITAFSFVPELPNKVTK